MPVSVTDKITAKTIIGHRGIPFYSWFFSLISVYMLAVREAKKHNGVYEKWFFDEISIVNILREQKVHHQPRRPRFMERNAYTLKIGNSRIYHIWGRKFQREILMKAMESGFECIYACNIGFNGYFASSVEAAGEILLWRWRLTAGTEKCDHFKHCCRMDAKNWSWFRMPVKWKMDGVACAHSQKRNVKLSNRV